MTLLSPALVGLAALLLVAAVVLGRRRGDLGDWARVLDPAVLAHLAPQARGRGLRLEPRLALAAALAVLLAAPAVPGGEADTYRDLEAVIVAVDLSRSMAATDARPDRAGVAREAARRVVAAAGARDVALVLYAGDAFLAVPFARDTETLAPVLATLQPGAVADPGSDAARALALSATLFEEAGVPRGRLVLVGDGGGLDDPKTLDLARRLAARGHRLDLVLAGTPAGGPVPGESRRAEGVASANAEALAAAGGGTVATVADVGGAALAPLLATFERAAPPTDLAPLEASTIGWTGLAGLLLLPLALPFAALFRRRT